MTELNNFSYGNHNFSLLIIIGYIVSLVIISIYAKVNKHDTVSIIIAFIDSLAITICFIVYTYPTVFHNKVDDNQLSQAYKIIYHQDVNKLELYRTNDNKAYLEHAEFTITENSTTKEYSLNDSKNKKSITVSPEELKTILNNSRIEKTFDMNNLNNKKGE